MTTQDTRQLLGQAVAEIRSLRTRLEAAERRRSEPIAIIGMGCRFPGNASTPDEFWEMLERGTDTVREMPAARARLREPGEPATGWGAYLDEVDQFDPLFFGISPREAKTMDPQQRMFLEVSVEALEHAGLPLHTLEGSRTGVYVGLCNNDYVHLLLRDPRQLDTHAATGVLASTLTGRLAYVLGLRGPNLALDTGCSGSLVAVHLAVRSLRSGETDLALVGAVNLILSGKWNAVPSKLHAFAADGKCKVFDARADGTVRGEGCGVVVLKRLSDALRDGDTIRAVIRGSAVNQDGRSTSLTSPNVLSQQSVIREALADGGLPAAAVGYVETHGTGTSLGDPIEFEALKATYGATRADGSRCILGAVKSNIGHLEPAAGMAGLIKAVVSLERGSVPPNLHFRALNPRISLADTCFLLPTSGASVAWSAGPGPRAAAVSSFGIGGTNAHVVLEQAPARESSPVTDPRATLLVLSAKTEAALAALAKDWVRFLGESSSEPVCLAATAALRRSHFERRLAVVGRTKAELVQGLAAALEGGLPKKLRARPRVAFVFQGLGGQWLNMAQSLLAEEPAFQASLQRCDEVLRPLVGWSVNEELRSGAHFDDHVFLQPISFALQVSLVALLAEWGIAPAAVIGHSVGEIAAAHVAGALSLEEAAQIICRRSELHATLGEGAMALVALSMKDAQQLIEEHGSDVVVAASNGPRTTVLSGALSGLEAILKSVEARGVFCRLVKSMGAGHSPQVDPLRDELVRRLSLEPQPTRVPFYSTVRADIVPGERLEPAYWGDNMRQPVLFAPTLERLAEDGFELFLEIGSHPILTPSIAETLQLLERDGVVLPVLRRGINERETLLRAVAALHTAGVSVDFSRIFPAGLAGEQLPRHAWEHESHWLDAKPLPAAPRVPEQGHPLLGAELAVALPSAPRVFEVELDLERAPFLRDHRVAELVVFPGAAYLDLAWSAARRAFGEVAALEQVRFERVLTLREHEAKRLQLVFVERSRELIDVHISSATQPGVFERHFQALVRLGRRTAPASEPLGARAASRHYSKDDYYRALSRIGLSFGPAFSGIQAVAASSEESIAELVVPDSIAGALSDYAAHPALLDVCFQAMGAFVIDEASSNEARDILLPTAIQRIVFHEQILSATARSRARRLPSPEGSLCCDLMSVDAAGRVAIEASGFTVQRIGREQLSDELRRWLHVTEWRPSKAVTQRCTEPQLWLTFADDAAVGGMLTAQLEALGAAVVQGSVSALEAQPGAVDPLAVIDAGRRSALRGVVFALGHECDAVAHGHLLCARLTRLLRAIAEANLTNPPRLFVVTRGAAQVGKAPQERRSLAGALLQGMLKSLAYENAELVPTLIDLDPEARAHELGAALLGAGSETQIALRGSERYVARLCTADFVPGRAEVELRPDASYLLVGGLGGLGLGLARYLVQRGARTLVLAGRSPASEEARRELAAIEALGARLELVRADVACERSVAELFDHIDRTLPPLRGVFHLALVLEDASALQLDAARIAKVFGPKVLGAHHLHQHTRTRELDLFVLFSSAAAIVGSPGQASYAAANAYLDALAEQRRAAQLPALSINLGLFARAAGQSERLQERGLEVLREEFAFPAIGRLCNSRQLATMGLFRLELSRWAQFYPMVGRTPFFGVAGQKPRAAGAGELRQRIAEAEPARRQKLVEQHLREELGRVLHLPPARFDAKLPWASYGIDSLMGLEIRNRLEATLGIKLPAIVLYAEPNLAALSASIAWKFQGSTSSALQSAASPGGGSAVSPGGGSAVSAVSPGIARAAVVGAPAQRALEAMSDSEARAELKRRLAARRGERA